jgi:hypothetical protein
MPRPSQPNEPPHQLLDTRRLKYLSVTPDILLDFFVRGSKAFGVTHPLPIDSTCVDITFDPWSGNAKILIYSSSFPILQEGERPPPIDPLPYFTRHP